MVAGVRRGAALVAVFCAALTTAPANADPQPPAPGPGTPAAPAAPAEPAIIPAAVTDPGAPPPPGPDPKVASSPPVSTTTPDGWTMTLSAKDEMQAPIAPLTTAISTREYEVGGVFNGSLTGGEDTPSGVFEVGYQIGCGIDMSTSNGVAITGTAGLNPSIGYFGFDFPGVLPDGLVPAIGANLNGGVTVGLKPGFVNTIPVTKKRFEADQPWVTITGFRIKIDGCVGESFVRSYAILTKSDNVGDAILSWYGVTKAV